MLEKDGMNLKVQPGVKRGPKHMLMYILCLFVSCRKINSAEILYDGKRA